MTSHWRCGRRIWARRCWRRRQWSIGSSGVDETRRMGRNKTRQTTNKWLKRQHKKTPRALVVARPSQRPVNGRMRPGAAAWRICTGGWAEPRAHRPTTDRLRLRSRPRPRPSLSAPLVAFFVSHLRPFFISRRRVVRFSFVSTFSLTPSPDDVFHRVAPLVGRFFFGFCRLFLGF